MFQWSKLISRVGPATMSSTLLLLASTDWYDTFKSQCLPQTTLRMAHQRAGASTQILRLLPLYIIPAVLASLRLHVEQVHYNAFWKMNEVHFWILPYRKHLLMAPGSFSGLGFL